MSEPVPDQPDIDLLAASLRADAADVDAFLPALAARLEGAIPGAVEVTRSGGRFGRRAVVQAVAVRLGERRYHLRRGDGGVDAEVVHEVRGVRLSGRAVPVEEWITGFAADLAEQARTSAAGRAALARLLG